MLTCGYICPWVLTDRRARQQVFERQAADLGHADEAVNELAQLGEGLDRNPVQHRLSDQEADSGGCVLRQATCHFVRTAVGAHLLPLCATPV